jgi:hypothetical protein
MGFLSAPHWFRKFCCAELMSPINGIVAIACLALNPQTNPQTERKRKKEEASRREFAPVFLLICARWDQARPGFDVFLLCQHLVVPVNSPCGKPDGYGYPGRLQFFLDNCERIRRAE